MMFPQPHLGYPGQFPAYAFPNHHPPPGGHTTGASQPHFNPMPTIEFPRFDGTDPKGWVLRAEQYFEFITMDEFRKVKLAGLHVEGKTNVWYRFYQGSRTNISWKIFQADVISRFEHPDLRDVQDRFNKLSQTGIVGDYEDTFEELRALVVLKNKHLTEDYSISSFVSGLQDHIKGAVTMFRPQTLADTVFLAKQEEAKTRKLAPPTPKPVIKQFTTPVFDSKKPLTLGFNNGGMKPNIKEPFKPKSTLSSKEILERRAKGLCFHCDDLYHPGKECKAKLYSMVGDTEDSTGSVGVTEIIQDMEDMLSTEDTPSEISLNAMAGTQSFSTVRLQGTIKNCQVSIWVDSGSTHSFIDDKVVKKLGFTACIYPPLLVSLADGTQTLVDTACQHLTCSIQGHVLASDLRVFALGGSDMVLGVDWLKQHNPVTFDFKKMNINISCEGKRVVLNGDSRVGRLQTISCKKLSKLIKQLHSINQGYLCLINGQVPGQIREQILWECHDSAYGGHSGQEATFRKIS